MAELVSIMGVTHSPTLPARIATISSNTPQNERERQLLAVGAVFAEMRESLDAAQPDVLLVVGCDHLNQLFMDNMPAFLIGKGPVARGPFPNEQEWAHMPSYDTTVAQDVARAVVTSGFEFGVDFAYSDEFVLDHSFTVPLSFLRPDGDVPIVPLFCNVIAPPLPPARRFFDVGMALRRVVEQLPGPLRIGVVASGHLSIEIGGPRMRTGDESGRTDPEFDRQAMALLANADIDGLCRFATPERMSEAGNLTSGFLTFVLLAGIAAGGQPVRAEEFGSFPFISWGS